MRQSNPKTIKFRRKSEPVIEIFRVRGRTYFALEKLSRRGAFRVFDRNAGPDGDYRILYQFRRSEVTKQKIEVLRRMAGKTANRNFPQLVDYAAVGDVIYVVLTWVWGTNLRDYLQAVRIKNAPRPTTKEVVRLVRGLTHGVSHYHRRANLIHGDISPANIILTSGTTQLVLIDFGSAWPIEMTAQKEAGDGVTFPYSAPERTVELALADFRADQFSLGVVAYELLTLEIPFDGLGGRAGLVKPRDGNEWVLVPPSSLLSEPERLTRRAIGLLDDTISKCLSLECDNRFGTRSDWLSTWDELHREFEKGSRLSSWESRVVGGIEYVSSLFNPKRK